MDKVILDMPVCEVQSDYLQQLFHEAIKPSLTLLKFETKANLSNSSTQKFQDHSLNKLLQHAESLNW